MSSAHESILRLSPRISSRASDPTHLKWLNDLGYRSFTDLRVLDLGCGSGYLVQVAKSQGASLSIGVDIEEPPEWPLSKQDNSFIKADLNEENWVSVLPSEKFDLILAFDIIEHLRSPVAFLDQCQRMLSVGGSLCLTTPNSLSIERYLKPTSWSGVSDPQHRILFTRYSLAFLLKQSGFIVVENRAPLRSLSWLPSSLQPSIGGQILVKAKKNEEYKP